MASGASAVKSPLTSAVVDAAAPAQRAEPSKNPLLLALGERVRNLRGQRGLTRKDLALAADVSERHLANLEYGVGNASILVLNQVASALRCSLAELVGDGSFSSPESLLIRQLLDHRSDTDLRRVRIAIGALLGKPADDPRRNRRIALIGLRGAGKSTLGRLLADDLDIPLVELSREIETLAGCSIREIHDLYGTAAYRRYERRALEEAIASHSEAVIATTGGIVSDAATFRQLVLHCTTIWLRAAPEEHMHRVSAQGDLRPMAASSEAMEDLRRILESRAEFYAHADRSLDTSGQSVSATFEALKAITRDCRIAPV